MKLNAKSLAIALALLWGGAVLLVGIAATVRGVQTDGGYYGKDFLLVVASVYPGYKGTPTYGDALIGGLYALVDGAISGALIAWIYNLTGGGRSAD